MEDVSRDQVTQVNLGGAEIKSSEEFSGRLN